MARLLLPILLSVLLLGCTSEFQNRTQREEFPSWLATLCAIEYLETNEYENFVSLKNIEIHRVTTGNNQTRIEKSYYGAKGLIIFDFLSGNVDCVRHKIKGNTKLTVNLMDIDASSKLSWYVSTLYAAESRLISIIWAPLNKPISIQVTFLHSRTTLADIDFRHPGTGSMCRGNFRFTSRNNGVWGMHCKDDLSASGTIDLNESSNNLIGSGTDLEGNKVSIRIGPKFRFQ